MNIIKEVSNLMCVSENDIHMLKDNIGTTKSFASKCDICCLDCHH